MVPRGEQYSKGHHGQEGGNGNDDGNRGGDGREDEYGDRGWGIGDEHEGRDGGGNGSWNGRENGDENRDEGGGEREPGKGRKTRKGGQRQRGTSNHSRKIRRPSETVASRGGPDPGDGRRGTGSGRAEERQRSARNPTRVVDAYVRNRRDLSGKRKTRRQERAGSVAGNPDNLQNREEAGREAQGTQGLGKNCSTSR